MEEGRRKIKGEITDLQKRRDEGEEGERYRESKCESLEQKGWREVS